MKLTFLGTSGAIPTSERNPSGLVLERDGERMLFDCGEGTQRQMMRYNTGFDIEHIFISHLHGDHVLGLPGLLQTWNFNERERPLAIHAPAGTRRELERLISVGGTDPSYPVRLNQVNAGDVVLNREEYELRAFDVEHQCRAIGYALIEADRKGRFDRETAEHELGIPPGPKYSKLHAGEPVEHDGRTIQPGEVVGPPRPGRRLVYTGDTRPVDSTVEIARDADLLIHDGTFGEDHRQRARETAHSTAREAATVARKAGAKRLVLTHISTRYTARWRTLEREATDVFDGKVVVADDGMTLEVPFPDTDDPLEIVHQDE